MRRLLMIIAACMLFSIGFVSFHIENTSGEKIELSDSLMFSHPEIIEHGDGCVTVEIREISSYTSTPRLPVLPVYKKTYTFPFGTKILGITYNCSPVQKIKLSKDILLAKEPKPVSKIVSKIKMEKREKDLYPEKHLVWKDGAGLKNDKHVVFLTIYCYPVQYSFKEKSIYFTPNVKFQIKYQIPKKQTGFPDEYDLLVIAPSNFSQALQPLIDHKESRGIRTLLMTTESIYSSYDGRDEPEKIKYFIKYAIENYGVKYVLLVGSIYYLPIRTSYSSIWHFEEDLLTDLYYADIYDANGSFCSWDSNGNNKFGETDVDEMDLYPDVYIGRLACDSVEEVEVVVDKIIHYENETYGQEWFKKMIFIGGDTFPRFWSPGNEGEEINKIIMNIMCDFEPSAIIWTSKHNFNRRTISNAINQGAGFVDYSGHGFEHGMGTYPPHGRVLRTYLTPYIKDLVNGYKLPIIFFDACLTAKLDFVLDDLLSYKGYRIFKILYLLPGIEKNMKLPCFAWCFVKHSNGGAIATIGATRTAYGGIERGAGKISIEFFKSYNNSETLGQMMLQAQNAYITDVPYDAFTVEEFILLGDPSLRVGGYPS